MELDECKLTASGERVVSQSNVKRKKKQKKSEKFLSENHKLAQRIPRGLAPNSLDSSCCVVSNEVH